MTGAPQEYRLYHELAGWWPLVSPPREYTDEAAYLAALLGSAGEQAHPVRTLLDLGSGGGHMAMHLKDKFTLTLVDLSQDMLDVSRRLNPECAHVRGDMRTVRLGQQFDAVLVHDAIDYVTTQSDLLQVVQTAFAHCRADGIALFVPDYVAETFSDFTGGGGGDTDAAGRQGSFRERTWDPDPSDDWVQAEYEFTLRSPGGTVQVVREAHRLGAFSRATWRRVLSEAGFEPAPAGTRPAGGRPPLPGREPDNLFAARRRPG
jgi:SAM-dependent methyltransferase